MVQALQPTDLQSCLAYAVYIQQLAREQNEFIRKLIMSDKAHCHLNRFVNKQNCRIWAIENPRTVHQRELHLIKCTIWCCITSTSERAIEPYFFEDKEGVMVTATAQRYQQMIENCLRPAIQDNLEMWFQQDGVTAHTARQRMALLRGLFGERLISRFSGFNWPSRSPDLTAPDFFLWGYLKGHM